jgi:hypothetical protein
MRPVWVILLATCACNFRTNPQSGDAPPVMGDVRHDAAIDSPPDAFDPKCFGSGAFYFCLQSLPTGNLTLPDTIDTSDCGSSGGTEGMVGATSVCVFASGSITIDTTGVSGGSGGGEPLVIVATGDIELNDSLDASSATNPFDTGPGANYSGCSTTNNGATAAGGGGAGAGGSFGGKGANGGTGLNGATAGGTAEAAAMTPVTVLRGGCRGGSGAPGTGQPASGGPGGGAVYLVARGTITVDGLITVSGGGGNGGNQSKGGGGGGGSGGMVVFHAGQLQINSGARIFANGGGGGGGAGQGTDGLPGDDATQFGAAAAGGMPNSGGSSAGGNGAFGTTPPTLVNGGNGGGGGGGGVGVIRVLAGGTIPAAQASPPAT